MTGGGHLTMVRPLARGVATNLSLVLSDGSVLSIGLRESDLSPVHTVVHLGGLLPEEEASVEDVASAAGAAAPVFLPAADVEAVRREEERALEALRSAEAEMRDRVEAAAAAADEAVEAFVAGYPTRLHFVFEFNPDVDVMAAPYWVEGMWHDTQSTFIRFRRAVDDEIVVAGFLSDGTAQVLPHEVIGVGFVIRIDGVVEAGILGVGDLGAGVPWRIRREAEPWQSGN